MNADRAKSSLRVFAASEQTIRSCLGASVLICIHGTRLWSMQTSSRAFTFAADCSVHAITSNRVIAMRHPTLRRLGKAVTFCMRKTKNNAVRSPTPYAHSQKPRMHSQTPYLTPKLRRRYPSRNPSDVCHLVRVSWEILGVHIVIGVVFLVGL